MAGVIQRQPRDEKHRVGPGCKCKYCKDRPSSSLPSLSSGTNAKAYPSPLGSSTSLTRKVKVSRIHTPSSPTLSAFSSGTGTGTGTSTGYYRSARSTLSNTSTLVGSGVGSRTGSVPVSVSADERLKGLNAFNERARVLLKDMKEGVKGGLTNFL